MGEIMAVATPTWHSIGFAGLVRFEEFTQPGQMAHVPWIRAHYEDGHTQEFNVALLVSIERAPDAETAEGEETHG